MIVLYNVELFYIELFYIEFERKCIFFWIYDSTEEISFKVYTKIMSYQIKYDSNLVLYNPPIRIWQLAGS